MGRPPCYDRNEGINRGPWTAEEDQKLIDYIQRHGHGSWRALPEKAGLQRCGKSCRLRWINYLRPDIKRGKFTLQEEQTLIRLHALLGNRWSAITAYLPKRTDNEIKNHWNTHVKKKLVKLGIDPTTHKPKLSNISKATNLSHMAQWESARLEAEARLVSRLPSPESSKQVPPKGRPKSKCLDVLKAWQSVVTGMLTFPSHGHNDESEMRNINFGDNNLSVAVGDIMMYDAENELLEGPLVMTGTGNEDANIMDGLLIDYNTNWSQATAVMGGGDGVDKLTPIIMEGRNYNYSYNIWDLGGSPSQIS